MLFFSAVACLALGLMAPGGGGGPSGSGGWTGGGTSGSGGWTGGGWSGSSRWAGGGTSGSGEGAGGGWSDSSRWSGGGWHDGSQWSRRQRDHAAGGSSSSAGGWGESAAAAAASPDGESERKKPTLVCSVCKTPGKKEDLLLMGTDWQAQLPLCCYHCQDEHSSPKSFSDEVQQRWKNRRFQKKQEEILSRTATWQKIQAETEARFPGESRKDFRQRLVDAWYTSAALIAMAFTKATAEKKAKIVSAFEEFASTIEAQSVDETHVPDPDHRIRPYGQTGGPDLDPRIRPYGQTGGPSAGAAHVEFFMPFSVGQWVDEICTGINEHYICRRVKCLTFARSTEWIESEGRTHFKCPQCGAFYRPWSSSITGGHWDEATQTDLTGGPVIAAQKIMVMYNSSGEDLRVGNFVVANNSVRYMLTEWSDTKVEVLKTRLKEVFADIARETFDMPLASVLSRVRQMTIEKQIGMNYLEPMQVPEWLKQRVIDSNKHSIEKFSFDHISSGFMGGKASPDLQIMSEMDSTRLWIMAKYAVTAATKSRM